MKKAWHRGGRFVLPFLGVALIVFFALVRLGFFSAGAARVLDAYENVAYKIAPSPNRAALYGERHFSAQSASMYDIGRAEYFYREVEKSDMSYPYLYHQLARIEFLKGNFALAMLYINKQIELHGDSEPNSYYIRGLIEGYMGNYDDSVRDYGYFLRFDPSDWAALNDYAWVLLKDRQFQQAADVTNRGLVFFPDNPWLLNSRATALFELGRYQEALASAQHASVSVASLSDAQWSHAYPGNDPAIAGEGVASFKEAVANNIHSIELAIASSTVQFNQHHE